METQVHGAAASQQRGSGGSKIRRQQADFPGDAVVKNPPANSGDTGSSCDLGRSHMLWSN